jgi:hypothetical protein
MICKLRIKTGLMNNYGTSYNPSYNFELDKAESAAVTPRHFSEVA